MMISLGVLTLFLSSGLAAAGIGTFDSYQYNGSDEETTLLNTEPLWLRVRNQIKDMLGVCDGNGVCDNELELLSGMLTTDGTHYYIDDIQVSFGPLWYICSTVALEDYDIDGTMEHISDELSGLVGSEVSFEGFYQSEHWYSVFTINDLFYRAVGRPIWSNGNGGD